MADLERPSFSWQRQLDQYNLPIESYTAHRLQHATPEHLFRTTRRCFIGPIPSGWLKSHRRDWYKQRLHINYSSHAATFSSDSGVSRNRRLSGLEGPSVSAAFGHSFPQPDDVDDEQGQCEGEEPGQNARTQSGNQLPILHATMSGGSGADTAASGNEGGAEESEQTGKVHTTADSRPPLSPNSRSHIQSEMSIKQLSPQATRTTIPQDDQVDGNAASRSLDVGDGAPLEQLRGSASSGGVESSRNAEVGPLGSTSNLIRNDTKSQDQENVDHGKLSAAKDAMSRVVTRLRTPNPSDEDDQLRRKSTLRSFVHFDIPENSKRAELHARAHMTLRHASTRLRRSRLKNGLIVKMEKMLVRVDATSSQLPEEYDENDSQGVEYRTTEKWREYMVVCRQSTGEEADYTLQMYKTRVIPAVEETHVEKRSTHQILLGRKIAKVNLYSALDKTVVLWVPGRKNTDIYIMQPRSSSNAVEWYTFLRNILGWSRSSEVQINIPDMNVSMLIKNPFKGLETSRDVAEAADGDDEALLRTMKEEQAAATKLIDRCVSNLGRSPEWDEMLNIWSKERIGLCWKRYDRLEWVHGANERKMYGTIAMLKSHDLELRVKEHYPTTVHDNKHVLVEEPPPVEGFLVRLTSQKGSTRRMGLSFSKRLYFSTHNQYLVFCPPAKVAPPPPPKLPPTDGSRIPEAEQIAQSIPLVYSVNPYPIEDGEIAWLKSGHTGTTEQRRVRDENARNEDLRKANILLNCDGFIDLCDVKEVRKMAQGTAANEQPDNSDLDSNVPTEAGPAGGNTNQPDALHTFELVMSNGLIVRLQAYDEMTTKEWIQRLRALVNYWQYRTKADIQLLKTVRQRNLEALKIDEEAEAFVGQFARKWEVTHTYASSELYNLCGISCCRTIHMSGALYRKPRRHSTFKRCSVILSAGKLLIFQDALRKSSGKLVPHIHHERISSFDLEDCYLYSGLLTESELLYRNRTFDSNKPGHHALPRIYLEDGWTSTDEDVMCCFVIWHGKSRSWFRSEGHGARGGEHGAGEGKGSKLKLVSQLGVPGRSVVFRARSRAERDHWVLAIQTEIEKLVQEEDFRITEKSDSKKKTAETGPNGSS